MVAGFFKGIALQVNATEFYGLPAAGGTCFATTR
jgi:hypothetical protein